MLQEVVSIAVGKAKEMLAAVPALNDLSLILPEVMYVPDVCHSEDGRFVIDEPLPSTIKAMTLSEFVKRANAFGRLVVLSTGNCTVTDCVLLANRGYLMRIHKEETQLRIQRRKEAEEALEQQRRDARRSSVLVMSLIWPVSSANLKCRAN